MSIVITATVTGLTQIQRSLDRESDKWKRAVGTAIYQKGLAIMADSVLEVPVDTGRLRQTAYVAPPRSFDSPEVEAGYGTDYAVFVHEDEDATHTVGKSQYLRDPLNRHQGGYTRWIQKRARKNFRTGVTIGSDFPRRPKEG